MPISLARVRDRTVEADLEVESEALFGDEKPMIHVAYRPSILTPAFEAELRAFGENDSSSWAKLVSKLVAAWDVESEPGVVQSLEFEDLLSVPGPLLSAIVIAIRGHIAPNSTTDGTSGDGSSPAESSETSPSTTHSFERPSTPASRPGN